MTPGKIAALGCLVVVVLFLLVGLSCARACFRPRRSRVIYRRRVVYVQKPLAVPPLMLNQALRDRNIRAAIAPEVLN